MLSPKKTFYLKFLCQRKANFLRILGILLGTAAQKLPSREICSLFLFISFNFASSSAFEEEPLPNRWGAWTLGIVKIMNMALQFTTSYLEDSLSLFRYYKNLAERAIGQVPDEHLLTVLDEEMNSIATIVKHLSGSIRSRWTDFLTSDGEKPDRNRDMEFVEPPSNRAALLSIWEDAWKRLFTTVESLSAEDLPRTITIRGEAHSVLQAINRQLTHCTYHCGQIVLLAKHFQGKQWQSLTVPRGKSEDFNRRVLAGELSQR